MPSESRMKMMRKIEKKPKVFGINHDTYSRTDPVKAVGRQSPRGCVGLPVDLKAVNG